MIAPQWLEIGEKCENMKKPITLPYRPDPNILPVHKPYRRSSPAMVTLASSSHLSAATHTHNTTKILVLPIYCLATKYSLPPNFEKKYRIRR